MNSLTNTLLKVRYFSTAKCLSMPYKASDRPPLSDREKRLYPQVEQQLDEQGYPIYNFKHSGRIIFNRRPTFARRKSKQVHKSREDDMVDDLDWPSMWPTAKTFIPSAVPLPLKQSYEPKPSNAPRGKYCNTELLKIQNFLHLTPVAVERHCRALKKFCTKWPDNLDTDEQVRAHFPVTYVYSDYLHSSPTIRDLRARIVTLKINMDDLQLDDDRQREKMKQLAGHRYDEKTNIISIEARACPTRIQNQDYADYMLTALYFESKKYEKWEDEKSDHDALFVKKETPEEVTAYQREVEKMFGLNKVA